MTRLRIPFVILATAVFALGANGVAWADVAGPSDAVAGALGIGVLAAIGLVVAGIVIASVLALRRIGRGRRSQAEDAQTAPSEDRQAS